MDRLAAILDGLSAIEIDLRIQRLPATEAWRLAEAWRAPSERGELPTTVAGMCDALDALTAQMRKNVAQLRRVE